MRVAKQVFYCFIILFALILSSCGAVTQHVASNPKAKSVHLVSTKVIPTPIMSLTPTPQPMPAVGTPARLIIPSISVNANIEKIGVLSNGDLATPTQSPWDDAGWYSAGVRPGESGSSVIDGHLDRPGGYPAVFWNLRYMHVGDTVMVVDSQGKTLHFKVTGVVAYQPQQAPIQQIFSMTGGTYLNLITCAGTWIPSQHQTTQRLVVYTVLE